MIFALLILIVFLCIMGFILAFIYNIFEDQELGIGRAIWILIVTGVITFFIEMGIKQGGASETEASLAGMASNFIVLALLLKYMAYTTMKRAMLMSLVYAIVALLFGLGLAYLFSSS